MQKRQLLLAAIILVSSTVAVQSQSSTQYDKGTPPQHAVGVSSFGSYISTELGTVNLANGSLNFKIPIGTIGGRGMSLPLTLNYSSKVWSASIDTDTERESMTQQPVAYADYDRGLTEGGSLNTIIGAGWTIAGLPSIDAKRVLIGRIPGGPNVGCYNYELIKLTLYLPDRGEIELRDDATDGAPLSATCPNSFAVASRGTRWHATDGSGIIFINDVDNGVAQWPAPNLAGVVITADGTRIRFGENGSTTDRNGNQITGYTDPLGRTVTVQHNVPDPENPSVTLRVLVTLPGYGGPRYYKIKTGIMNQNYRSGINPNLPVITGDWDPEGWGYNWWGNRTRLYPKSYGLYAQRIDDVEVLTELVLPDGRSLRFKYNTFGEVAEVQLPTGGKMEYDYSYSADLPTGSSPIWETTGSGSIVSDVKFVDRTVREKRTYPDGVTLEGKWNYSYGSTSASASVRSASDTLLSDTLHYFLPSTRYTEYAFSPGNHDGSHYTLWSTGVEWRTETRDAAGVVIAASEQDWTQRAPVVWPTYSQEQPANDNRVNQARKYLETGAMSKVETFYDLFNNPTEVKEYDFDQSLKRRTLTTYSSTNPVNGVNYAADSIRLINLPLQQSIYDSAGVEQARTTYEYDIYTADGNHDSMLSYPLITGHDTANYGTNRTTRGNVTRIGNWIKTTDSYVYTYPRYDIAGNVVSAKDPRGNLSTVSFADDFGNGSNPGGVVQGTNGPTYAFPTLITSPPPTPGAPVHTARSQYDFSTGLLTGFKDRNGIITQTIYNDAFNRPSLVKSALGVSGVESHAVMYYAPSTTPFGIVLDKNDVLTVRDQTTVDDAVLRSWTRTDGFGRTIEGWSKDPQGDVKVATAYDALGRTKQVSNPYRPSLETPNYTTSAYDLAGRVTSVTTPDNAVVSTSYSGNEVTVTDQAGKQRKSVSDALGRLKEVYEAPNDANYNHLTSYSYDTLDNLITVNQGSQTRTFVYDSLKRLTSATNPESGAVTYQYDDNGNLLVKTDARLVSSHYEYDALNRLARRWYNGSNSLTATTHNSPALPSGVGASDEVKYFYDSQTLPSGAPSPFDRGYATGRLVAMTYGGGSAGTYVGFDALGKPLRTIQQIGGINYQTSAIHNLAGAITSMSYPSGHTITNSYDGAGRLQSFSGNLGDGTTRTYANDFQYTALNGLQQEKFGTDTAIYHKQRFNSRGQLWDMRASTVSFATDPANGDRGAIVSYYSNTFTQGGSGTDNNGNLLRQENYIPSSSFFQNNFEYDQLNRLKFIAEKLNGTGTDSFKQAYVYDRWGNRTIDQTNTSPNVPKPNFGVNTATNQLTAPAGYAMSYDAAGNLTNDTFTGEGPRTYDAENKMTSAGIAGAAPAAYAYDGDGHRIKRIVNGMETWQVYGIGGELLAEYPANAAASNPQKEYGYRNGELLVTTETSSGGGGSSAQPVTWTSTVGVTANGNNLTKTAADGWGNAGAASTQTIASGDGYVEFTTTGSPYQYVVCGLSHGDTNQNYPDVDFGLYAAATDLYVVENSNVFQVSTYTVGDTLRVAVESGVVKYRKNGTVVYTSTLTPTYPLLVDTALYSGGISNAVINNGGGGGGGGGAQNASWTNTVGVSVSGNNLTKTAADGWNNSGASSTQTIASGDGYVEFTANETTTARMCGLAHSDPDQNYGIDFALGAWPGGTLYRFEFGVYSVIGTYAAGDVLRVAVEGGVVKYKKNGTVVYTSTIAPTYPLLVDTSLYSNGATLNNVVISGAAGGGGGGSSTQIRWLVTDQLGTPRMIFDQSGSLASVSRHDYLPFGEELFAGTGGRTTAQGYTAGDNVRQKFTQKERDNETGLDYFLARYYSSTQGRFTGVDPFNIALETQQAAELNPEKARALFNAYLSQPQQWNRYSYAINNPLLYVDPDGEAIQLSNDKDERERQLQALREMVGQNAGAYLYANETADGNWYVGIRDQNPNGDTRSFEQVNEVAGELGAIVRDDDIVSLEFVPYRTHVGGGVVVGPANNWWGHTPGVTGEFKGRLTIKLLDWSKHDLGELPGKLMSDRKNNKLTAAILLGHELGHARARMTGDRFANQASLRLENKVRKLQSPGGPTRRKHN